MMQTMNQMGGIAAYIILYFIFNVAIPTFARLMGGNSLGYTRKHYLITLIPLFGLLYAIYLIMKSALNETI